MEDGSLQNPGDNDCKRQEDHIEEYLQNLLNGKKNLLCGDYTEAVTFFQTACALQSDRFGDTAPECAEAFFYYGKALLELARQENEVLGNAVQEAPDHEDSDSDDNNSEPNRNIPGVAKILREATDRFISTGHFSKQETPSSSRRLFDIQEEPTDKLLPKDTDENDHTNPQINEATSEAQCSNSHEDGPSSSSNGTPGPSSSNEKAENDDADDEENPDDIPNMQLAWEMLELAKVLYQKKPTSDENSLMIAQCSLKLGELGLEIENYSQAIGDFLECLSLYKKLLTAHDRRLAEIHYSLGLAYNFDKQYDKCVDHYRDAESVLENRIEFLNKEIASKEKTDSENDQAQEEISDIKDLIPDISSKIEDVLISKKQEMRLAAIARSSAFEQSTSHSSLPVCNMIPVRKAAASTNDKAVSDISHLVRKKRTNDDSSKPAEDEVESKKPKKEIESQSHSATNGKTTVVSVVPDS